MAQSVYVETSFVGACVTDRNHATSVYRREISQAWWSSQEFRFSRSAFLGAIGFQARVEE
jgi:hypothetical protein